MATQVQFRRGTSLQHTSFTGAAGEVTVNTTNKSLHVHDGTTANGFELAKTDLSNVAGNLVGNINSSGVSTFSTINFGGTIIVSTSTTTTTTSATSVASISTSTYRSAVFQVQAAQGINYNVTTINVVHDGTETYMTEYGTINQPVGIATFGTDINAGSLRLLAYPASTSSTTFRVVTTATQI
jgi:hypothetical protein